jgi:hypothetical protein
MVCAAEMVQNYFRKVPICGTVKLKKQNTQKFRYFANVLYIISVFMT